MCVCLRICVCVFVSVFDESGNFLLYSTMLGVKGEITLFLHSSAHYLYATNSERDRCEFIFNFSGTSMHNNKSGDILVPGLRIIWLSPEFRLFDSLRGHS